MERRNRKDRRNAYDLDYFRKDGFERRKISDRRAVATKPESWFTSNGTKRVLIRKKSYYNLAEKKRLPPIGSKNPSHQQSTSFSPGKNSLQEKRAHIRHLLTGGLVARPKMTCIYGNVRNISLGGLALQYNPKKGSSMIEAFEMDIFLRGNGFNLQGVPFKTVSEFDIQAEGSFITKHLRQTGVKFLNLSPLQLEKVNYLINYHSIGPA